MNPDLSKAVAELVKRAAMTGKSGKLADAKSMEQLVQDSGKRIPAWYVELLVGFPLGGLEIAWMEWSDPNNIRSESLECYPGLAILERGWINVASDSGGSGDPYFIPTDQGDNPPVFQVYHDVGDKAEVILAEACRLAAPSLSDLFRQAKVSDG